MSQIRIDASTAEALKTAEPGTELLGPEGNAIGVFVPTPLWRDVANYLERLRIFSDPTFKEPTLEELRASDAAGGEIPMEEVFKLVGVNP